MGSKYGARPPNSTAYFVALAGILFLLLLLCCYFIYFCIRRVKELSQQPLPEPVKSVRPPPRDPLTGPPTNTRTSRQPTAYPVRPNVRESATAMAHLCQLPPSATDTVHPRPQPPQPPLPPPRVLRSPHRPPPNNLNAIDMVKQGRCCLKLNPPDSEDRERKR